MVVITHEMRVVEQICDRVAVLEQGKIVESGRTADVFESPKTEAARRLIYTREYADLQGDGSGI